MTTRGIRILKLSLLLGAAAAGLCESEDQPYFALSSQRTFGTNSKPWVGLSAWKVDSLEFRVYRIQDPALFFRQIEEPHQFGGRAPRPPRERTLLERIHAWKHSLRAGILRGLRAQFTEAPSSHFTILKARPLKLASAGTKYAGAPLLNSQQLALAFVQPVRSRTRWERQTVELGLTDKGVYLVEAVHGDLRAYTVTTISDIVMITKTHAGRMVNMVVDRATGQPAAGAKLAMLAHDAVLGEAETNADGMAEMRLDEHRANDVRLLARRGADIAVNALSGDYALGDRESWVGYIYTDRPVYRPGHVVHFKGVFRTRGASAYEVPAGKKVSVEIYDPEQKPVYQKTLTASANGTVRDDLTLAPGTGLGSYYIQVKAADSFMNGDFEVEEYKKPEYDVKVTPAKPRVLEGESVQALIDARYYFGEPVSGAKVQYAVYRDRYWLPMWHESGDEEADSGEAEEAADMGDQLNEGEGVLDADGKLTITLATSISDRKYDYRYRVEARVTDAAKREISGRSGFLATYGSFALNVSPDRYFYSPGTSATFKIEARDYDNHPVSSRAHVELVRWNYKEPEKSEWKAATDVTTGSDGTAPATFSIPSGGGSYRVRATARTPEGRDVESFASVWVEGEAAEYDYRQNRDVQIVPDKKTYRAGDTARLLIVAEKPGTAVYVSVEGRELRECKLLRSQGSTVSFEIPVTAGDEPGITVQAGFVRDGEFHNGTKYLKVPPVEHQLNVRVATDKPQYLPGQTAEYSIDVTDGAGKPAPRAELSLGVVDEAIYAVRRDSTPDILTFFYGREWNRVNTETSLDYYFYGEAGKRQMRLAELRPPSRLAQLKPERLVAPKVRKAFPDTAFWAADISTDGAGHASAKVEFPDSLTTWRATARGVTPDTKAGGAAIKTVVRKNLILRLAVPRFLVQGDEAVISALVLNYLAETKNARVSLDVAGLDVLEGATKQVEIPSRGEAKVDWRVRAQRVRGATITGKALTDEESDALELELPVNPPGVKMAVARSGALAGGASASFDLTFPATVEPGSRSLSIRLSPSIAGSLFGALEFLTSFPYGCVEQTMSSFLPNITVSQTVQELGLKTGLDRSALDEKIRDGLDRLYSFQHEDGGWGWWQTDESHHFMTAYVVAGLAQAKAAGVDVKADAIDKGRAWLQKAFAADPRIASGLRAYMAYALAVSGADATAPGQVYERRSDLSPYGMALLGLAFEQTKDPRAGEMAAELERTVQQNAEEAWWPAARDEMLDFSQDATPEATAYAVKLLSHQRPASGLLPKAALWLMNHRNEGWWWESTKQTAMVIYGLADYLKASHEMNPKLSVTVLVNDTPALTRQVGEAAGLTSSELRLEEDKLQAGTNRIRIATSGEGRLYYSARAEYYSNQDRLQKTGAVSLNILRDYYRLVSARDGERIVYDAVPLEGPVAPGDTLAVRLTVTGMEWKYLMVEDPIPAGTEFIERDDSYQMRNRPPWWQFWFTRRELHDDRLAIFQTFFPQGQRQYFYLLKVVNPGLFAVSPGRVQPMYQTGEMAATERRRLEVK